MGMVCGVIVARGGGGEDGVPKKHGRHEPKERENSVGCHKTSVCDERGVESAERAGDESGDSGGSVRR